MTNNGPKMRSSNNNNQTIYLNYGTTFVPNKINNSNSATTGRVETHELGLESISLTHRLATLEWADVLLLCYIRLVVYEDYVELAGRWRAEEVVV